MLLDLYCIFIRFLSFNIGDSQALSSAKVHFLTVPRLGEGIVLLS